MARFIPGVLGTPVGKTDGTVFRLMNGESFYSFRPESYNISQTKSAKNSRQAFGLTVKFAKLITSSPELSYCWKKAKLKGSSAYHRIIKHNLPLTTEGLLTAANLISPRGFDFNLDIVMVENYQLLFKINLDASVLNKSYQSLNVYSIIFLNQPKLKKQQYDFLVNSTVYPIESVKKEIQFSVNFSKSEKQLFNNYNKFIIYTALVPVSAAETIIHSSTIAKIFIKDKNPLRNFIQV